MKFSDLTLLYNHVSFFSFNDCLEIFLFYLLVYYISLWLAKDKKNNLLIPFYSFIFLIFFSYVFALPTIMFLLLMFSPALICVFLMIHQQTLQKNFISLQKTPSSKLSTPWEDLFVRSCLRLSARGYKATYLIEHTDHLSLLITTEITLDTPLQERTLELCVQSSVWNHQQMIWLTTQGKLYGINATYNFDYTDFTDNNASLSQEHQEALLLTIKTNALIINTKKTTEDFDVIMHGSYLPNLPAHQVLSLLKKYTLPNPQKQIKKGVNNDPLQKNVTQPNSS